MGFVFATPTPSYDDASQPGSSQQQDRDSAPDTSVRRRMPGYEIVKGYRLNHIYSSPEVAGTRIENGGLQNTSSGCTVGTEGFQEKGKEKSDGHHQTRFEGHGHHLG